MVREEIELQVGISCLVQIGVLFKPGICGVCLDRGWLSLIWG